MAYYYGSLMNASSGDFHLAGEMLSQNPSWRKGVLEYIVGPEGRRKLDSGVLLIDYI